MKRVRVSVVLAVQVLLFVSILAMPGCNTKKVATTPGKPRDENLIKVALATRDVAATVKAAIGVKRALLQDKVITQAQSAVVTGILVNVTKANDQLAKRSLDFDSFAVGRGDLLKLFEELAAAASELNASLTIKSSGVLSGAVAGVSETIEMNLRPLFK